MGNRTSAALEALPQVTIGAVNGLAIGGAVVFLACLDIRLAAESAWFSIPEVDLDIPLTWNALPRLMRELGPARTKELVMTCDRFSSDDALRWGFVNHVVPDAELLPQARALAEKLLAKDPLSLALTKSTTNALAESMVPAYVTHADPDYLFLSRLVRSERPPAGAGGR
jgi:enoyl-CoA hydratase/carnithine racemase